MFKREPAVAGTFYPSRVDLLEKEISRYLASVSLPEIDGEILGVISPHAGYVYSGPVAAWSFKVLEKLNPEVVVILAPSHRVYLESGAILASGLFSTPLGDVIIDEKIGNALLKEAGFIENKEIHSLEHSIEVQVPFVQTILPQSIIVPVIIGSTNLSVCRKLAKGLFNVFSADKRKLAFVISSDLSHYLSYEKANTVDRKFIEALENGDIEKLSEGIEDETLQACGAGPILTAMEYSKLKGKCEIKAIHYANSGDTSGSRDQVVGYLSAVLLKKE